jgi:hypothetical protein
MRSSGLQRRVFRREPDVSEKHITFTSKGEARNYKKKVAIHDSFRPPDEERQKVLWDFTMFCCQYVQ